MSRAKNIPALPKQRSDINIPVQYASTKRGDDFLLHSGPDNNILIFATVESLRHLSSATNFLCDGTFNMCPSLYYQLYTVHAFVDNKMVPLVYGLLPDKNQSTYHPFFDTIRRRASEHNINLAPTTVFTDFETAAQNAASQVFQCQLKGCLFHFRQCIWRKAQQCDLQQAFQNDNNVNMLIRRATALPLVQVCDIDDVWAKTLDESDLDNEKIVNFADYVTEQSSVDKTNRAMWNHFHTIHLEGCHSNIKRLGRSHPNLYKFTEIIQFEQDSNEIVIMQLQSGSLMPPKKRRYRNLEHAREREKRLLTTNQKSKYQYHDAVSHLVSL